MKKILCLSLISLLSVTLFSLSSAAPKPQFELLWSHDSRWEEHQTVKNGKVFCPMTTENPPNLKVVDLYTGEIEHIFDLEHRCGCAPWFVHNKVYLYAFKHINQKKPWPCVYVIDTIKWAIEHIWPINCGIDVEVCPYDKETNCFFLPAGCYKANSGKQVWRMKPSGRGGILIVGDTVYYHAKKEFRAHNKVTGALLWKLPLSPEDGNSYNTPIFDQDHGYIYIGSDVNRKKGNVYAIDVKARKIIWKRTFDPGAVTSVLTYHRGRIFVPLFNGPRWKRRVALCWKDGGTIWEKSVGIDDGWATSAVDDRFLYTASHGGGMFLVQRQATGEIVWQMPAKAGICSSPIICGGVVVVGTSANFFAVKIGTGNVLDADWRGNAFYTGYTSGGIITPALDKVPLAN